MATTYLTLDALRARFRKRLNDQGTEQYLDAEIDQCINTAYRETVVLSKCYKTTVTPNQAIGTHTYDVSPIFEVIQVAYNGTTIEKTTLADLAVYTTAWADTANGTPIKWMTLTSSSIRVSPPPDSASDLIVAYGYAFPTALTAEANEISKIPVAFGASAVLDRAEAEARRLRLTQDKNPELMQWRMDKWLATLEQIKQSRTSDR